MRRHALWLTVLALSACGGADLLGVEEPTQVGVVDPIRERGAKSFDQRKRDCWEMPNAQACYDVAMNYEMGLAVDTDLKVALEFYEKACELEKQKEHCDAAERARDKH
jgi:TPR repeat protein